MRRWYSTVLGLTNSCAARRGWSRRRPPAARSAAPGGQVVDRARRRACGRSPRSRSAAARHARPRAGCRALEGVERGARAGARLDCAARGAGARRRRAACARARRRQVARVQRDASSNRRSASSGSSASMARQRASWPCTSGASLTGGPRLEALERARARSGSPTRRAASIRSGVASRATGGSGIWSSCSRCSSASCAGCRGQLELGQREPRLLGRPARGPREAALHRCRRRARGTPPPGRAGRAMRAWSAISPVSSFSEPSRRARSQPSEIVAARPRAGPRRLAHRDERESPPRAPASDPSCARWRRLRGPPRGR